MPLYYAGIPLLIDQPQDDIEIPPEKRADAPLVQIVQRWLDRYSPLDTLRLFGSSPVAVNDRDSLPGNPAKSSTRLTVPNWSSPPPLRINELHWPCTGATRWARFVGLVDEARLDKIIAAITTSNTLDPNNKGGDLILWEGDSHRERSIVTRMYMLPPRRVAVDARAGATKLWLLPLVDERYLWQWQRLDQLQAASAFREANFTWTNFLGNATGGGPSFPWKGLGKEVPFSLAGFDSDAFSADYFLPDALSFDTQYENLPVVLDAAAGSVGMRVVRDFEGKVYLMAPARSATRLQDSLGPSGDLNESGYEIITGGKADKYNALRIPANVNVMLPKWWNNGNYYVRTKTRTVAGVDPAALGHSGARVIYTTAESEWTDDPASVNSNSADCETLALKIARDFYAWQAENYDYTFLGVKKWKPNGFDDWLICNFASNHPTGEPLTRVYSHPYDFGTQHQYQAFRFSASRGMLEVKFETVVFPQTLSGLASGTLNILAATGDMDGYENGIGGGEITVNSAGLYKLDLAGMVIGAQGAGGAADVLALMSDKTGSWARIDTYCALALWGRDSGTDYQVAPLSQSVSRLVRFDAGDKIRLDWVNPSMAAHQVVDVRLVITNGV